MRLQITFTRGEVWVMDPHAENLSRARTMEATPYGAKVQEIMLPANFELHRPGSPYHERVRTEYAVVIEITLAGLMEYCADYDVVATLLAQTHWDLTSSGEDITHHLFISDAVKPSEEGAGA